MTHLYRKLEEYNKTDFYPFHMPGHKRNPDSVDGENSFAIDITEIDGFDNLHHAEEILLEAQQRVAETYGVKESFYSVNGSTAGLLSAISAAVEKGGTMLVARNCHKAVYHAMYLRDIRPVYLYPPFHPKWGINGGILPSEVEKALIENKDIRAVLITSPTYDGVVSDVKKIAEITHRYNIPLIVDEAHGAHFIFSDYFPQSAAELGADLVIQSFHKTLPSMTQTAVLHRCSDRVPGEKISRFMGIYQTSSPSYVLMASMDACIDKLRKDGAEMYSAFTSLLDSVRKELSSLKNLQLIPESITGSYGIYGFDRSKILISTAGTGLSGNALSDLLRSRYHLEMEMSADSYITALTAVGDREEGFSRLVKALKELDQELSEEDEADDCPAKRSIREEQLSSGQQLSQLCIPLEQPLLISEAMDRNTVACPLMESKGQVSAEFAYFYPPGIPVVVPGERITEELLLRITEYLNRGFALQGLADYSGHTIRVVK